MRRNSRSIAAHDSNANSAPSRETTSAVPGRRKHRARPQLAQLLKQASVELGQVTATLQSLALDTVMARERAIMMELVGVCWAMAHCPTLRHRWVLPVQRLRSRSCGFAAPA
jgi:hypothetical protein